MSVRQETASANRHPGLVKRQYMLAFGIESVPLERLGNALLLNEHLEADRAQIALSRRPVNRLDSESPFGRHDAPIIRTATKNLWTINLQATFSEKPKTCSMCKAAAAGISSRPWTPVHYAHCLFDGEFSSWATSLNAERTTDARRTPEFPSAPVPELARECHASPRTYSPP